jgi:hypothetical protein
VICKCYFDTAPYTDYAARNGKGMGIFHVLTNNQYSKNDADGGRNVDKRK